MAKMEKTPRKGRLTKAIVLKAVSGSHGVMSTIAKRLGVGWGTAQKYVQKWEETRSALDDELQGILDLTEVALYKEIKKGDMQGIKYMLQTKGAKRGYGNTLSINGGVNSDGTVEPLKIIVENIVVENTED